MFYCQRVSFKVRVDQSVDQFETNHSNVPIRITEIGSNTATSRLLSALPLTWT